MAETVNPTALPEGLSNKIAREANRNSVYIDPRVLSVVGKVLRHEYLPDFAEKWEIDKVYDPDSVVVLDPNQAGHALAAYVEDEYGLTWNDLNYKEQVAFKSVFGHEFISTASAPMLVAQMTSLVMSEGQNPDRALDIGGGCGYQADVLKAVGFDEVTTVEIKPYLAEHLRQVFPDDPVVRVEQGDGKRARMGDQRYDAIVVAATIGEQETLYTLLEQLRPGGKMVAPVTAQVLGRNPIVVLRHNFEVRGIKLQAEEEVHWLMQYVRSSDGQSVSETMIAPVGFVPLK